MAIIKEQDKKNEKEEKSLQTGKDADKFPLDDDLLDDVAGSILGYGVDSVVGV